MTKKTTTLKDYGKHPINVFIAKERVRGLKQLALDGDTSTKNMIETELEEMAKRGLTYRALWNQYETTAQKLKELSKTTK